jgi:hypothetical protein
MDDDGLLYKKSKLRTEIEDLLKEKGLTFERKISAINLDDGETHYFDDYADLMVFLKGRKGRWYITTPGLRSAKEPRQEE